jgi:ParB family chromosome partitioning protein
MLIPVYLIDPPRDNVRKTAALLGDDVALAESIRALGLITPILVERDGDRFRIIAGARRYEAAIAAGLTEVPAEIADVTSPAHVTAIQVAENLVRTAMNPVDQWRALATLTDSGFGLPAAAMALGMTERHARKLDKLGRLHPTILAAILEDPEELPDERDLGAIASAPLDVQEAALRSTRRGAEAISFWDMARECRKSSQRITASYALFDTKKSDVAFEEDLFAAPGSPEQMTTADVDGFLADQKKALAELIERKKSAQWKLGERDRQNNDAKCPDGYRLTWTTSQMPSFAKGDTKLVHAFIVEDGAEIGRVKYTVFHPLPQKASGRAKPSAPAEEDTEQAARPDEDAGDGITAKGKEMIAQFKTLALRQKLREPILCNEHGAEFDERFYLRLLILAFGSHTVRMEGGEIGTGNYGKPSYKFRDLAIQALEGDLCEAAAELLARVLTIVVPGIKWNTPETADPVPEWIGALIRADAALPRFDTAEFLATLNGDRLQAIANENGIKPPKAVKELRSRLEGKLPDWRPTTFGAPPPVAVMPDDDRMDDDDDPVNDDVDQIDDVDDDDGFDNAATAS